MSDPKWSPGSWRVDPKYREDVLDAASGNLLMQAYVIPTQNGGHPARLANAQLAATAPLLYAVCVEVAEYLYTTQDIARVQEMAKSAMAKARGEA